MYQSEFDALTAQIARQSKELGDLQPELTVKQQAIDYSKAAADAAQKALDAATEAKKPLDETLAQATSNATPVLDRARMLQSGINSCNDAIKADLKVTPDPVAAPTTPTEITMVQAREQLIRLGIAASVQNALNEMPGVEGEIARMKFDTSTTVSRSSRLIAALAKVLKKDDAWLDQFFTDAKKL